MAGCSAWYSVPPSTTRTRASCSPPRKSTVRCSVQATPHPWPPAPASALPELAAVHLGQESAQLLVDVRWCFFVREMPCASDGYVAPVRRIALGSGHRIGKHVGVGIAAEVEHGD